MVVLNPKDIVVDFLRKNLTDPRSRAEDERIETFDGTGTQTEFTLTPTDGILSCIVTVSVDASTETKWKDYYIDFQNQKVVFYTAPPLGVDNVSITYKQGTPNWIYPDTPRTDLTASSFPRISVSIVSGTGERLGQYNAPFESSIQFQIDIWAKEDYAPTIDSVVYEGDKMAEYLGYQILLKFRSSIDELHPPLYNYRVNTQLQDLPFDREHQVFHKVLSFEMNAINVGET